MPEDPILAYYNRDQVFTLQVGSSKDGLVSGA